MTTLAGAAGAEEARLRTAWLGLAATLALAFLAWGPNGLGHALRDPDTYWHVAAGRHIWATGSLPTPDPFSHTMEGKRWIQHEWGADLILAAVHDVAGWAGLIVLSLGLTILALGLMARFLLRYLSGLQVTIVVFLAALLMQGHVLARPHVFAWALMAGWVTHVTKAADEGRPPSLWLALFVLVWANVHGSFILGLGVMGLLGLESMAQAWPGPDRSRIIRGWVVFGALCGLAALATPDWVYNVLHILHLQTQEVQLTNIAEWRPPDFGSFPPLEFALFLLLAVTWSLGARFGIGRIAIVLVLLHMSLAHNRHAEWLGLIAPVVLAAGLSAAIPARSVRQDLVAGLGHRARTAVRYLPAAVFGIFILAAALGRWEPDPAITPRVAVAAARAQNLTGNVLNGYNYGGYLIYSGIKTFADGRSDLFGDEFMKPYFDLFSTPDEQAFRALTDKHRVEWTLLSPDTAIARLVESLPDWTKVHEDGVAVVHRRRAPGA